MLRWMRIFLPVMLLAFAVGCDSFNTEYGRSVGTQGRKSIAGFGVLRDYYQRNAWTDRTLSRLSERLNNVDTIIWTPDSELPPTNEVTLWFEEWLARGDKTLIYVLRDHQTEFKYWQSAARLAPPEQRMEYRRRLARSRMAVSQDLLARPATITNGWFTAVPLTPPAKIGGLGGEWTETVDGLRNPPEIEYQVRVYDATTDAPAPTPAFGAVPGPASRFFQDYTPSQTDVELKSLLETDAGIPLISEVTSGDWNGSNVIVVSAGSLLTNFGLTDPGAQQIAAQLLAASNTGMDGSTPKVGFLVSDDMGVSVSSLDPKNMGPTGMEMFTVWPLNLVTIHAAILGLVVCLMLLPIFGRPRRLPPRPTADFSAHIDALAGLMQRTDGEAYAKVRISEYMVRVRGETDGPWVIKK